MTVAAGTDGCRGPWPAGNQAVGEVGRQGTFPARSARLIPVPLHLGRRPGPRKNGTSWGDVLEPGVEGPPGACQETSQGEGGGKEKVWVPLPRVDERVVRRRWRSVSVNHPPISGQEPASRSGVCVWADRGRTGQGSSKRLSMFVESVWGFRRDTGSCVVKSHLWQCRISASNEKRSKCRLMLRHSNNLFCCSIRSAPQKQKKKHTPSGIASDANCAQVDESTSTPLSLTSSEFGMCPNQKMVVPMDRPSHFFR